MKKRVTAAKTEKDAPLFSVIVLTYMQRHLLDGCLKSIFDQTYPNVELIICDDCSADFDVGEVERYIEENKGENIKRVAIYKQPENVGTVKNAQQGVEFSSGEYFKLHAGDDMLFDEEVLEKAIRHFFDSDINILAGRSVACQQDGTMTDHYYPSIQAVSEMMEADAEKQFELIGTQAWGEFINAPAVIWRRSFFDKLGGFDLSYKYTEDWPMWLKITSQGYRIHMVEEVLTVYRYGGISNDFSVANRTLGKLHYEESIRMFREMVMPVFEMQGRRNKISRVKHCIHCLELRRDVVGDPWNDWGCIQQTVWRLKELPFLIMSWLYRKRKFGIVTQKKTLLMVMGVCVLMYGCRVEPIPGIIGKGFWSIVCFATLALLILKLALQFGIQLMNIILNLKKKKDGT